MLIRATLVPATRWGKLHLIAVTIFVSKDRNLILGDDALLYIAYIKLIGAIRPAAVNPQLIAMTAECSST